MKSSLLRAVACSLLGAGMAIPLPAAPAFADTKADHFWLHAEAVFLPPVLFIPSNAKTYNMWLVPPGSHITVTESAGDHGTEVTLTVIGLWPRRGYGAHVHTAPCGSRPEDSGPHYQHVPDPQQPSTDPAYANPDNEVWLDFTVDRLGRGHATSHHDWQFRPGEARSVVLHQHHTSTEPGSAGQAGARLACFNVPFARGQQ